MQLMAIRAADLEGKIALGTLLGDTRYLSVFRLWMVWLGMVQGECRIVSAQIGKFLGIVDSAGNIMSYCILPESCIPIVAGTVQRMTSLEKQTDASKDNIKCFNNKVLNKCKKKRLAVDGDVPKLDQWNELLENDADFAEEYNQLFNNIDVPEADENIDSDSYDHYFDMELKLDSGSSEHP